MIQKTPNNFSKPQGLPFSKIWISSETVSRRCYKLMTVKVHQNPYLTFRVILKYLYLCKEPESTFLSSSALQNHMMPPRTCLNYMPFRFAWTSVGNSSWFFLLGHGIFFNTLIPSHGWDAFLALYHFFFSSLHKLLIRRKRIWQKL